MFAWKHIFTAVIMVATGLTSGCRSEVSMHGKTLSLFLVPMYKQPEGYSSTYRRHLELAASIGQHTTPEIRDTKADPVTPLKDPKQAKKSEPVNKSEPVKESEKVVFSTANGPASRSQSTVDLQSNSGLISLSRHSNRKKRHPGLIQPASWDRRAK